MKRLKLDIQKFGGNYSVSASVIGRSISLNQSTIRITATSSSYGPTHNYDWDAYINGSYSGQASGSLGTQYVYIDYNSSYSVSWDIVVTHKPNGKCDPINISCYHYITDSTNGWSSTSITPSDIPRASSITSFVGLDDGQGRTNNIEGSFKIEYTRYSSSFTDNLVIQYLNNDTYTTLKTINNYVSGDIFTFTNAELNTLFTNSTTNDIKLRAYLQTYSGQTSVGDSSKVTFDASIYDADPIFSDFEFKDLGGATTTQGRTTVTLTGDNTVVIKNYSSVEIKIPVADKAEAQKGATMSNYKITGIDEPIQYSDSQAVSTTINNCNFGTFEVKASDSRNNNTSVTKTATDLVEYEPIYLNLQTSKVERYTNGSPSAIGEEARLTINGTIWNDNFGSVTNSIKSATYRFKPTDSQTYVTGATDITPTINQDGTITFQDTIKSDNPDYSWNLDDSYDIQIEIKDELSSYTINLILNSAIPTISLSKKGVGIMCAYDDSKGGALQIAGEPYAMGDTLPINTVVEYSGNTVPTGYELVEDYSTDEIKTNQVWIDGKSIYRKVLHITSGIAVDTDKYINVSSLNIDNIVDLKGWTHQGGTGFGYISLYFNDGTGHGNKLHTQQGSTIIVYNHHWAASEIYIIIEYTKN